MRASQALLLLGWSGLQGCEAPAVPLGTHQKESRERGAQVKASLERLRSYEQSLVQEARLGAPVRASRAFGPDPYRVCVRGDRSVGLLRGQNELVLLNPELRELSRRQAPDAPAACDWAASGEIAVVGELAREVRFYRVASDRLSPSRTLPLEGALSPRALAIAKDTLFAADAETGKLHEIRGMSGAKPVQRSEPLCRGPVELEATEHYLMAVCLLDHAIIVRALEPSGHLGPELTRIVHDGPFWSISALERNGELIFAAGGVENRALERFDGAFGYVDSFVYLYRFAAGRAEQVFSIDTSDRRVLTPKALSLQLRHSGGLSLFVAGYGSEAALELEFSEPAAVPFVRERRFVPGVASLSRSGTAIIAASPLLDVFVRLDEGSLPIQSSSPTQPLPSPSARLGEALFFTELIAPDATSSGKKSRFTCETCHFEGSIDGRVHATGRGEVRVSTRPLFGLLQNRPHFSRALDPDLTSVSHNEFRVASLGDRLDPWFWLSTERFAWLEALGISAEVLDPEALRRALLDFLALYEPNPNPRVLGRSTFTLLERGGADVFAKKCEGCHSARRTSDESDSRVEPAQWEALIFSEASPLVWARGDYARTGIVPSVHPRGTRIPSLRRISRKFPYFTDGSADSLSAVIERVRLSGRELHHAGAPPTATPLSADERASLLAFLEIL